MKNDLIRRLTILEKKKAPIVSARMLRSGGMQGRLRRQQVITFNKDIKKQKKQIRNKLALIEQQEKQEQQPEGFGLLSTGHLEELEDFNEPTLRSMRSKRGFF